MPRFIVKGCCTASAMKGMLAKPSDRGAATRKIDEAAGGKLGAYNVTTGPSDFQMITSADDVSSLLTGLMVAGGAGAISNVETQRALTSGEFTEMQKKATKPASSYNAPA
jgi:uncharacterized protein with GYD domain